MRNHNITTSIENYFFYRNLKVVIQERELHRKGKKSILSYRVNFYFRGNGNSPSYSFMDFRTYPKEKHLLEAVLDTYLSWATPSDQEIILRAVKRRFRRGKMSKEVWDKILNKCLVVEGSPKFKTVEELRRDILTVEQFVFASRKNK